MRSLTTLIFLSEVMTMTDPKIAHPETKRCPRCGRLGLVTIDPIFSAPDRSRFTIVWAPKARLAESVDNNVHLEDLLDGAFGCGWCG
jgi:hypothetical protein